MKIPLAHYLQGSTEFPFALMIPQHEVEKNLEAKLNALGVEVHREMRLTAMEAIGTEGIKLTFENGETVQAAYVVAADGSRSTVRANFSLEWHAYTSVGSRPSWHLLQ
jgi:2-polyprenyl-6-methoxyphenol hydroxylase-like FAD-dependent oxidoreductase